jgi:hypothetical protein
MAMRRLISLVWVLAELRAVLESSSLLTAVSSAAVTPRTSTGFSSACFLRLAMNFSMGGLLVVGFHYTPCNFREKKPKPRVRWVRLWDWGSNLGVVELVVEVVVLQELVVLRHGNTVDGQAKSCGGDDSECGLVLHEEVLDGGSGGLEYVIHDCSWGLVLGLIIPQVNPARKKNIACVKSKT